MSVQIQCVYTAIASGALTAAQLVARMNAAAVPLDTQLLTDYGLSVTSDVTTSVSTTVTRTVTLSMVPAGVALATAALGGGGATGTGTGVGSVTIVGVGAGYTGVPVVTAQTQAGHPAPVRPALFHAVMSAGTVVSITIDDPGIGYDVAPNVVITPLFKSLFPDGTDQVSPLQNFMTEVLQNAVLTMVTQATPVVS